MMGLGLSQIAVIIPVALMALFWPILGIVAVRALLKISRQLEAINDRLSRDR